MSNVSGRFMSLDEFGGGGRHNVIFILEEIEGEGWQRHCGNVAEGRVKSHNRGGALLRPLTAEL